MTTSAAIDRLVHHSTMLELNTESYRIATAKVKKLTLKSKDIMGFKAQIPADKPSCSISLL